MLNGKTSPVFKSEIKNIVLFDMDGTLTPARRPTTPDIVDMITQITAIPDCAIGIVSGSPLPYIMEQMGDAINIAPGKIVIMPCNGTQVYKYSLDNRAFCPVYEKDMKEELGAYRYNQLVLELCSVQAQFIESYLGLEALTGHFISYRKSMVNFAPVGRSAEAKERASFEELDINHSIRDGMAALLKEKFKHHGLEFKLGGTTSIDIHLAGWDKTHALKHTGDAAVWFVGDKCHGNGNDQTIFNSINDNSEELTMAFETTGPENTLQIVNEYILPHINADK